MKPFSNLKDLKIKKAELQLKKERLKITILKNWHSLKESIQPKNIFLELFNKYKKTKF